MKKLSKKNSVVTAALSGAVLMAAALSLASCGASEVKKDASKQAAAAPAGSGAGSASGSGSKAVAGSGSGGGSGSKAASLVDFAAVNTMLKKSCANGFCHGPQTTSKVFVDGQAAFDADGETIVDRLTTKDAVKLMPPPDDQNNKLSDADREKMLDYLVSKGFKRPASDPGTSSDDDDAAPQGPVVAKVNNKVCSVLTSDEKTAALAEAFGPINTLTTDKCGGGGCHVDTNQARFGFVGHEELFTDKAKSAGIVADIKGGSMPKGRSMSDAERREVINWICARVDF